MAKRQGVLSYPEEYYFPEALRSKILTTTEMREEYSHLRKIANKRLKAFENSEFSDSKIYLKNRYKFVPLKDIADEDELIFRLYEAKRFLTAKGGTVTGQRKTREEQIKALHDKGLTFITKENLEEFGNFMDTVRQVYGSKMIPDSEQVVDLFRIAIANELSTQQVAENFEFYRQNMQLTKQVAKRLEEERKRLKEKKDKKKNPYEVRATSGKSAEIKEFKPKVTEAEFRKMIQDAA